MELLDAINTLKSGEELNLNFSKKNKEKTPPFTSIGNGHITKDYPHTLDTLKVFGQLSPAQQSIMLHFRDMLENIKMKHPGTIPDNYNLVTLSKSQTEEADQATLALLGKNSNARTLIDKKLIKKISSTQYRVSPFFIIPPKEFKRELEAWEALPDPKTKVKNTKPSGF